MVNPIMNPVYGDIPYNGTTDISAYFFNKPNPFATYSSPTAPYQPGPTIAPAPVTPAPVTPTEPTVAPTTPTEQLPVTANPGTTAQEPVVEDTAARRAELNRIYQMYFGRDADDAGFEYWNNYYNQNQTTQTYDQFLAAIRNSALGDDITARDSWYASNWNPLNSQYLDLAYNSAGIHNIGATADNQFYSPYEFIVGDLANHSDFIYDRDLSLATNDPYAAVYRSLSDPDYSVTDYQINAKDFRRDYDWSTVIEDYPELTNYLLGLDGATDVAGNYDQSLEFLHNTLNKDIIDPKTEWRVDWDTIKSKGDYYNEYTPDDFISENNYKQFWGDNSIPDDYKDVYYDHETNQIVYPYLSDTVSDGEKQYYELLNKIKSSFGITGTETASFDPLSNLDAKTLRMAENQAGFNNLKNTADKVLIKDPDGNYSEWGQFSKYITPVTEGRNNYWVTNHDVNTQDEFNVAAPADVKLGESAGGHFDKYASDKFNDDIKSADWLRDPNLGLGYMYNQTDDWSYAPDAAHLKLKSQGGLSQVIGPLLTIASFIPPLAPIAAPLSAAYNIGSGISSGNWGQVIGGAMGIPGVSNVIGGLSSSLANGLGVSPTIANALLKGGLSGIGSAASGGDFLSGALGGGLSSIIGNQINTNVSDPTLANAANAIMNNVIMNLANGNDFNPQSLLMSGIGGVLKTVP